MNYVNRLHNAELTLDNLCLVLWLSCLVELSFVFFQLWSALHPSGSQSLGSTGPPSWWSALWRTAESSVSPGSKATTSWQVPAGLFCLPVCRFLWKFSPKKETTTAAWLKTPSTERLQNSLRRTRVWKLKVRWCQTSVADCLLLFRRDGRSCNCLSVETEQM